MTTNVIQHTTIDGQRWDTIALINYGSADMMNKIMEANPSVPKYDQLPAGLVLNIPIIDVVEVVTTAEMLPPWKQKSN